MIISQVMMCYFVVMELNVPYVVARYELEVLPEHRTEFHRILDSFYEKASAVKKNRSESDAPKAA